jgi:CheY-like chemotaxis protein
MPRGGKFVIETSNVEIGERSDAHRPGVEPGNYVMIAVSDTGTGMGVETREKLFEPFFTTKDRGKGSGLGLSIVYGIVRQNQGYINVYSQQEAGTIFEIYLPSAKETTESVHRAKAGRGPKGSETILIADDEDSVRKLVYAVLATHGYNVMEARDGQEALEIYEKHRAKVDMVVTDVVMPRMNGFELGQRLISTSPGLRILYMSGYRDSTIGTPDAEVSRAFLNKPFTPDVLLAKVREVLDTRKEQRSGT